MGLAFAHPHVFVDATVKALFNEKGFSAIHNHWVYDEIYSAAMIASGDKNKNGKIDSDENGWFQNAILEPLAKSNYYNYVLKGVDYLPVEKIADFKASVVNGRLVLDFDARFSMPIQNEYTMLVAVVADPTNYIQITADMEKSDVDAPDLIDVEFFNDALDGLTMFKAFQPDVEGLYIRFRKKQ
ncbi:Protein of unknown function [Fibrobacter sp. UWEL]|nr:Protein of unknown function [Fibrobacter sp. UWEL]